LLSITENISTFIRVANGHIDHAILLFKINPGKQLFIYKLLIDNSDRIGWFSIKTKLTTNLLFIKIKEKLK